MILSMNRIRLILLDDHGLFRASVGHFLASEADFEVVGICGTSGEALEILIGTSVDVVLLEFDLGAEEGTAFIANARRAGFNGRFLIVTRAADGRNSALALKLGASGIFLKSDAPDRLLQAIRAVANGEIWVDQRVIHLLAEQLIERDQQIEDQRYVIPLEARERKVLLGILGGLTNKKIGGKIGLAESSVKAILQGLFIKAGVRTRSQLVRAALEGSLKVPAHQMRRPASHLMARQSHG
jgi:DNA-binding NarL/FixJ family response regulator